MRTNNYINQIRTSSNVAVCTGCAHYRNIRRDYRDLDCVLFILAANWHVTETVTWSKHCTDCTTDMSECPV